MGGEIGVQSTLGAGSTFWFVLPLQAGAAPAAAEASAAGGLPTEAAAPVRCTIAGRPASTPLLLVEDNFVNQRVALHMLAKLGYQVDVAMNGREAIDRLTKTRYQLVLMDCQMPEMDGFEATRHIRDATSAVLDHEVPIVAMTANAFPEDRHRSIACGMNDFLSKPVDQATLAAMLDRWLSAEARSASASA
jgi:CheY-like chemotaxis protein